MNHCDRIRTDIPETVDSNGVRWRLIPGCTRYYAGSNGQIKSFANTKIGKIMTPDKINSGYLRLTVTDWNRGCTVHRLVAMAFIDNPDNLDQINHKDGDKTNNSIDNLEWCDAEYNVAHAMQNGLFNVARGEDSGNAILTEEEVRDIYLDFHINHLPLEKIADKYGVNTNTARAVVYKNSWVHVTDPLDARYKIASLKNTTTNFMTKEDAGEIYLLNKVRGQSAIEIQKSFPQFTLKAIQCVIYKATWTKITDKLDKKYGWKVEKKIVPLDEDDVRAAYIDVRVNKMSVMDVSEKYGINDGSLSNIIGKRRWKDFTDKIDREYGLTEYKSRVNKPLDEETVIKCYKLMKSGYTSREVSKMMDISNDVLRMMLKKKSWKSVTDKVDLQMEVESVTKS